MASGFGCFSKFEDIIVKSKSIQKFENFNHFSTVASKSQYDRV